MKKFKVLVFDIELSPMLAYVWDRRDVNISLNHIRDDWFVIAWAAKWLDEPASSVIYRDQRNAKPIGNDKDILVPLWKLLDEADIVITQNGKNFDSPKLNARFIMHGMKPPSPYKHLDTYQIVRRVAKFTSNKLEYLTDKLCTKYKKLSHKKFPGMSLWSECLAGNKAAWDEMKRYNIHDVLSTEEFYNKIKPWTPSGMTKVYKVTNFHEDCGVCGGRLKKSGTAYYSRGAIQRYACTSCGTWSQGEVIRGAA